MVSTAVPVQLKNLQQIYATCNAFGGILADGTVVTGVKIMAGAAPCHSPVGQLHLPSGYDVHSSPWKDPAFVKTVNHRFLYGYGSIPINTIFMGMNIHLPAILMFTRGTRF